MENLVDIKQLIAEKKITSPVGLSGCRALEKNFESCDFDITVFDGFKKTEVIQHGDNLISLHHGSLEESSSDVLVFYDGMQIIEDESWDLRMFLSKIREKRKKIFRDFAKNRLIESLFCCQKAMDAISNSDQFAPVWQKSASILLADGICSLNFEFPSSHMADSLRKFEKNQINEKISVIHDTIGIERATPVLLERMVKSTVGLSDKIENNGHSKIIQKKYDYFLKNSMLSDCYFYLCKINKDIFIQIKDSISRQQDLIHILKTGFDLERDETALNNNCKAIQAASNDILQILSQ